MHPNLVKLYRYCYDTRLALAFDEGFTGVLLLDVILSDDFGWDKRMKVATQLADLFSCLHENSIALGCVTLACIMIDEEINIKIFDFGYVTCSLMVDVSIIDHPVAPEFVKVCLVGPQYLCSFHAMIKLFLIVVSILHDATLFYLRKIAPTKRFIRLLDFKAQSRVEDSSKHLLCLSIHILYTYWYHLSNFLDLCIHFP